MSKRNFILLVIVLVIAVVVILGFFFFNNRTGSGAENPGTGTNFFARFNPFASNKKTTPTQTNNNPTQTNNNPTQTPVVIIKLKKVSSMPIAGFTTFSKERLIAVPAPVTSATSPAATTPATTNSSTTATTTNPSTSSGQVKTTKKTAKPVAPLTEFALALRYVARATGNIYETFADNVQEGKFTTTIIPKVYDAYFGNSGNSVLMRYLQTDTGKNIETFVGNLPKEYLGADTIANNDIKGTLLPENVESVSVSPDTSNVFYLFNTGSGDMIGTTMNFLSNKKVQIFDSPFTEWSGWWGSTKTISLTTKPASTIPGYVYQMDQNGKNFIEVLGDVNGLTTLASPDGKLILYGDNNLNLSVYNTSTNTSMALGVKTLPEKCTWNNSGSTVYCAVPRSIPDGQYPDTWYQGEASFSDILWKIDATTGNTDMLVDPLTVSGGEDVDGIKLAVDSGENYLFFVNKKDSYLWEFNLH
jgi:hypothetical protein